MAENKAKSKSAAGASKPSKPTAKAPRKTVAKTKLTSAAIATGGAAIRPVDQASESAGDWRAATLVVIRQIIHETDPEIIEERKWIKPSNPAGVAVWSHGGIVCTGETHKQAVKLTFARGASLEDPAELFNSSLEGNVRRAIDIREGEMLDVEAFKALIQAAVADNLKLKASKSKSSSKTKAIDNN